MEDIMIANTQFDICFFSNMYFINIFLCIKVSKYDNTNEQYPSSRLYMYIFQNQSRRECLQQHTHLYIHLERIKADCGDFKFFDIL